MVADAAREKKEKEEGPDVLAREAAHILADAIDLLKADRALASQVLPAATVAPTTTPERVQ